MKSEGILIGIWTRWENHGNWGHIVVEKTYRQKMKRYMLKVLGENRCSDVEVKWETHKGLETKFTYGLTEMTEYKGREYASNPVVFGINTAGGEPQIEQPIKEIQREPEVIEDDDTLPF